MADSCERAQTPEGRAFHNRFGGSTMQIPTSADVEGTLQTLDALIGALMGGALSFLIAWWTIWREQRRRFLGSGRVLRHECSRIAGYVFSLDLVNRAFPTEAEEVRRVVQDLLVDHPGRSPLVTRAAMDLLGTDRVLDRHLFALRTDLSAAGKRLRRLERSYGLGSKSSESIYGPEQRRQDLGRAWIELLGASYHAQEANALVGQVVIHPIAAAVRLRRRISRSSVDASERESVFGAQVAQILAAIGDRTGPAGT